MDALASEERMLAAMLFALSRTLDVLVEMKLYLFEEISATIKHMWGSSECEPRARVHLER